MSNPILQNELSEDDLQNLLRLVKSGTLANAEVVKQVLMAHPNGIMPYDRQTLLGHLTRFDLKRRSQQARQRSIYPFRKPGK